MTDTSQTITIHPPDSLAGEDQQQRVAELVRWGRDSNRPPAEVAEMVLADLVKYQTKSSA